MMNDLHTLADKLADKNLINMALEVDMVATKLKQGEMVEVTALVNKATRYLLKGDVVINAIATEDGNAITVSFTDVTAHHVLSHGERFLTARSVWTAEDGSVEDHGVAQDEVVLGGNARVYRPVGKGQIIHD